jgi:hypothetical protein
VDDGVSGVDEHGERAGLPHISSVTAAFTTEIIQQATVCVIWALSLYVGLSCHRDSSATPQTTTAAAAAMRVMSGWLLIAGGR